MNPLDKQIQAATANSLAFIRKLEEGKTLKRAVTSFLNEEDTAGQTNLSLILEAKKDLALNAKNEMVREQAQNSLLKMVADDEDEKAPRTPTGNNILIQVNGVKADNAGDVKIMNNDQ